MVLDYLDRFEEKVSDELLNLCTYYKFLDGMLLSSDDIDERWKALAPEYVADAIPQISDYPTVSVAWAGYIGLAMAWGWDKDWTTYSQMEYKELYGDEGFDDKDEHIVRDLLGLSLDSQEARGLEEMMRRCAQAAVDAIRHEQIEPQSPMAFHAYARTVKVMYRIGAAIELKRLGYKFERVDMPEC